MGELVWSDSIAVEAGRVRDEVASRLRSLGVPGRLALTGASSVPGALTRGDIDLHLRVPQEGFAEAVGRLGDVFAVARHSAWAGTLAVFDVPGRRPTGLAVTPARSEHDVRFRAAWLALRRRPELLAEYNALKRTSFGTPAYEERKSAFFTRVVEDFCRD